MVVVQRGCAKKSTMFSTVFKPELTASGCSNATWRGLGCVCFRKRQGTLVNLPHRNEYRPRAFLFSLLDLGCCCFCRDSIHPLVCSSIREIIGRGRFREQRNVNRKFGEQRLLPLVESNIRLFCLVLQTNSTDGRAIKICLNCCCLLKINWSMKCRI